MIEEEEEENENENEKKQCLFSSEAIKEGLKEVKKRMDIMKKK